MNKAIVTTTINTPQSAIYKFLSKTDWTVIVVGDTKTPHDEYKKMAGSVLYPNLIYLDCQEQEKLYPELSAAIGWKSIRRRNIGFVYAYNAGAQIIATVDDDNIPYLSWGSNCAVNCYREVDTYDFKSKIFDPLSVTNHKNLWHRGFPLSDVKIKNDVTYIGKNHTTVAVQADLWDGDPDVDAIQRITLSPCVKFDVKDYYMGAGMTVFDSQNTFLSRECFPYYCVLPFVGRMDDIFGSYIMQIFRPDLKVVFGPASVYQARNAQNLTVNMREEYIGYEHALEFIEKLKSNKNLEDCIGIIPKESYEFYKIYTAAFKL